MKEKVHFYAECRESKKEILLWTLKLPFIDNIDALQCEELGINVCFGVLGLLW